MKKIEDSPLKNQADGQPTYVEKKGSSVVLLIEKLKNLTLGFRGNHITYNVLHFRGPKL